jgi:hypothetical protein
VEVISARLPLNQSLPPNCSLVWYGTGGDAAVVKHAIHCLDAELVSLRVQAQDTNDNRLRTTL